MNKIKRGLCGLAALLISTGTGSGVPTTNYEKATPSLIGMASKVEEPTTGPFELAFGGEPVKSYVLKSKDSGAGLTGYILALDDYKKRVGFLIVGSRENVERLRGEVLGSDIVQIMIRNYDKNNYIIGRGRNASEKEDFVDSVDLFYAKPVNVRDCIVLTYGGTSPGKVKSKTIWFQKEK